MFLIASHHNWACAFDPFSLVINGIECTGTSVSYSHVTQMDFIRKISIVVDKIQFSQKLFVDKLNLGKNLQKQTQKQHANHSLSKHQYFENHRPVSVTFYIRCAHWRIVNYLFFFNRIVHRIFVQYQEKNWLFLRNFSTLK